MALKRRQRAKVGNWKPWDRVTTPTSLSTPPKKNNNAQFEVPIHLRRTPCRVLCSSYPQVIFRCSNEVWFDNRKVSIALSGYVKKVKWETDQHNKNWPSSLTWKHRDFSVRRRLLHVGNQWVTRIFKVREISKYLPLAGVKELPRRRLGLRMWGLGWRFTMILLPFRFGMNFFVLLVFPPVPIILR